VYLADQLTDAVFELFTSRPDGSNNVRVSGPLVAGGNVQSNFAWAPDSSRIAYQATQFSNNVFELFTSRPDGSNNVRVSGPMVAGSFGVLFNFAWALDSSRIAYLADQLNPGVNELFTVTPDGALNPRVSGAMVLNGDVFNFAWALDSSRIVYRADQITDEVFELFASRPDGNTANINISGPLTTGGSVVNFALN
jgi:hypothetical protein